MSKLQKYLIAAVVTAAILFLIWYFSNIVAYILISAVLAIIGKPMVDTIERLSVKGYHAPRWLAALLALLVIWAVVIIFFRFFIPLVFSKINELASFDTSDIIESFRGPLIAAEEFMRDYFSVGPDFSLEYELTTQFPDFLNIGTINSFLSSTVSFVVGTAIALFSITFITFFFLKQDRLFVNMVVLVFPKKYEANVEHAMDSVTRLLIRYFTGILAESTIMMILVSGSLLIWGLGAETAIFMGLLVGILNVIPYIGPIISCTICIIVGILSPMPGLSALNMALIIGGTIIFAQAIDNFLLQPMLYSNRVNAHPLEIFLVILIAGSMAGVLGMLLAIPAYNVLRVFAKEFFNNFRLVQKLTENI